MMYLVQPETLQGCQPQKLLLCTESYVLFLDLKSLTEADSDF